MHWNGLMIALLLTVGCEAHAPKQRPLNPDKEDDNQQSPPKPASLAGYVLVRSGAPLYLRAGDNAPLVPGSPSNREPELAEASVYRVISQKENWIEVENLPMWATENKGHCYGYSEKYLPDAQLRFWVRTEDLHAVTIATTVREFADGSRIELRPGAAIVSMPTSERPDRHFTQVEGFEFFLELSKEAVGLAYFPQASEKNLPRDDTKTYRLRKDAHFASALAVGDSMVRPFKTGVLSPGFKIKSGAPDGVFAEVRGDCLNLTTKIDPSQAEEKERGLSYGVLGGEVSFLAKVRKGAPVYWRGGEVAGSVYGEMRFEPSDKEADADGERRCFRRVVRKSRVEPEGEEKGHWKADAALDLCFDRGNLIEPPASDKR